MTLSGVWCVSLGWEPNYTTSHPDRSLKRPRADETTASPLENRTTTKTVLAANVPTFKPARPRSSQDRARRGTPSRPGGSLPHGEKLHIQRKGATKGDPKLHVGRGNVVSYRWVARSASNPNHDGTTLEAMTALRSSQESMGLQLPQEVPFLVIAMPDLFMTVDSMERRLSGLLEQNSRGRLLLVRIDRVLLRTSTSSPEIAL